MESLATSIDAMFKQYRVWAGGTVTTGVSVNGGSYGKSILAIASGHVNDGDATGTSLHLLRCGYDGNHLTDSALSVMTAEPVSFTVDANGYLVINSMGYIASVLLIICD